jgi:RNA-directed DNA polymerase
VSLEGVVKELSRYLRGWQAYFGYCQTPSVLKDLDSWVRRRLRAFVWRQWRRGTTRYARLRERGVGSRDAAQTAASSHGPWRMSMSPALQLAYRNADFVSMGLPTLGDLHTKPG